MIHPLPRRSNWSILGGVALAAPLLLGGSKAGASSASSPSVPRFVIAPSPIGLVGDVRPRQYVGVLGRKAAWLGTETGEVELWVHPLKICTAFRLDFRIPDYDAPVRGADVARRIEVRPELATITYSHATFTVRQHILAPLDQPGLLILLEVDTYRPLEVVVSFRSVFQEAWPGGFGGQSVFWDGDARAFVLSESRRQENAFIGSPWARAGTNHPAHALPDAPSQFVMPIDPARAAREMVPIAVAASKAPREDVRKLYDSLLERTPALYEERRRHADRLRQDLVSIDTPDDRLDLAFEWAKVNLDEQRVCNPDLGCGLVAGWGPSGEGLRPGFGWFFGGDAAINSLAMSLLGMHDAVAEGLRFLAVRQRADGKIPHEVSQSAGRIPWFTDFPYAYYHADTTPFWLVALASASRDHPDEGVLRELWPAAKKAWAFCRAADTDGDGLMENTAAERAVHAEALVRWRHPVHGLLSPDEFIGLAEQSGNIGLIAKWVLRRAIEECARWNREGLDLGVAVNLSALDLYDAALPTFISGLLHDQGLDPGKLVLEITESAVMKDAAYALKTLRDVKTRGITLAIDDFGTGYSSLAHLKRLPLDELKIDKSFVVNLGAEATEDGVIVRSTIDLGHNMGLKVVAEGVESAEGYQVLERFGCDMAQGYFISRPLPSAQFLGWMRASPWGVRAERLPRA